jgi:hypothetical protein
MIAVIGCKRQKQDYCCPADEMYSKAFTYVAQRDFIKLAYDDYFIFSSKYGIIHHTEHICPYDMTLQKTGTKYQVFRNSKQCDVEFIQDNVKQFLKNNVDKSIHFHTTLAYMSYVKPLKYNNVKHVKQQQNTGMIKVRYNEGKEAYDGNLESALDIIQKPIPKNPESSHNWIYNDGIEFEGRSYDLWKQYPEHKLDQACLRKVGFGKYKQHKGWVIKQ